MQSGSTAGLSRLYFYSGRRKLPSHVGWSQEDGAGGGGGGQAARKTPPSSPGSSCSEMLTAAGLDEGRRQLRSVSAPGSGEITQGKAWLGLGGHRGHFGRPPHGDGQQPEAALCVLGSASHNLLPLHRCEEGHKIKVGLVGDPKRGEIQALCLPGASTPWHPVPRAGGCPWGQEPVPAGVPFGVRQAGGDGATLCPQGFCSPHGCFGVGFW